MNAIAPAASNAPARTAPAVAAPAADALQAALLFAIDPVGLGGVLLRGAPSALRDDWLAALRAALPALAPFKRVPLHAGDERLLGGLDLAATLQTGRPVAQRGLLADADGGVLVLAMAERVSATAAARLAGALDTQRVSLQREGLSLEQPARVGLVALDEGGDGDEPVAGALRERLAFHLELAPLEATRQALPAPPARTVLDAARARLARVQADDGVVQALCEAALVLGVDSLRASLQAVRAACAAAALAGRERVVADDAALAARLVLGPRATRLPPPPDDSAEPPPEPDPPDPPATPDDTPPPDDDREDATLPDEPLQERVLEAARAAIPAGLLAALVAARLRGSTPSGGGPSGALQRSKLRGRPIGATRGDLKQGARLDLIATLRAAAPWQVLRRRELAAAAARASAAQGSGARSAAPPAAQAGVLVRREDFHIKRFKQRRETTTVFVVDASGSAALHRLAEAKGAVERLLADCYVRRDRVALIAFRGSMAGGADLLLPPTRSLVRAKRSLAALPGGGGTPLAAGIDAARGLAEDIARRGGTPLVVLLTDGRANIARDGSAGRTKAADDALAAARLWRATPWRALLIDTSPQPQPVAGALADAMGARYLALPHADAAQVSLAAKLAMDDAGAR